MEEEGVEVGEMGEGPHLPEYCQAHHGLHEGVKPLGDQEEAELGE